MPGYSNALKVECQTCPWRGQRVYIEIDALPSDGKRQTPGFGACPKCAGALQRRQPRRIHGISKLSPLNRPV